MSLIRAGLEEAGCTVFLAHEREEWGANLMVPEVCTLLDLEEMGRADVVVAVPGQSGGVHMELGWASVLRKPIILLLDPKQRYSPLVLGLSSVALVETLWADSTEKAVEAVKKAVRRLAAKRARFEFS
ncbi:MAG: nucleoside 2-deoxyribosyltransferase [Acetobacteraceae bacterium]|nr:nucleoside 2-deoxyribosyltransferase [Acetobacteraceae bacterium]